MSPLQLLDAMALAEAAESAGISMAEAQALLRALTEMHAVQCMRIIVSARGESPCKKTR